MNHSQLQHHQSDSLPHQNSPLPQPPQQSQQSQHSQHSQQRQQQHSSSSSRQMKRSPRILPIDHARQNNNTYPISSHQHQLTAMSSATPIQSSRPSSTSVPVLSAPISPTLHHHHLHQQQHHHAQDQCNEQTQGKQHGKDSLQYGSRLNQFPFHPLPPVSTRQIQPVPSNSSCVYPLVAQVDLSSEQVCGEGNVDRNQCVPSVQASRRNEYFPESSYPLDMYLPREGQEERQPAPPLQQPSLHHQQQQIWYQQPMSNNHALSTMSPNLTDQMRQFSTYPSRLMVPVPPPPSSMPMTATNTTAPHTAMISPHQLAPTLTPVPYGSAERNVTSSNRPPINHHRPRSANNANAMSSVLDKYILLAGQSADSAKIRFRNELKLNQRRRESEARDRGEPLSARDKERERSRRESSVTRRRAEVYVQELEATARKLPALELENEQLRHEISKLRSILMNRNLIRQPCQNIDVDAKRYEGDEGDEGGRNEINNVESRGEHSEGGKTDHGGDVGDTGGTAEDNGDNGEIGNDGNDGNDGCTGVASPSPQAS